MLENVFIIAPSLKPGQSAPDFAGLDQDGKRRQLAEFKGRWLVIFFYPADFTPGCTKEACAFRDLGPQFQEAGAALLGVSGDSVERHHAFRAKHQLPYPLLSDPEAVMRRAYGVPHILGRLSGRSSFVIDPQGIIRHVFNSRGRALEHTTLSLEFLNHAHG